MSKQQIHRDDYEHDLVHREKRIKKLEKIQALRALLQMWEAHPDHDHEYILDLRSRLRSAENQFNAMQP